MNDAIEVCVNPIIYSFSSRSSCFISPFKFRSLDLAFSKSKRGSFGEQSAVVSVEVENKNI